MRINFVFLIVFLISSKLFGLTDFSAIDRRSVSIPDSLKTTSQISAYLVKDLKNDIEKVRAFYIWISHNIKYDIDLKRSVKRYKSNDEIINEVLEKRTGVCQHYAELFHAFCQKAGIKSYVIRGYVRNGTSEIMDLGHTWNAVLIDRNYYNIDVTWASGYTLNNVYFSQFKDAYFLIEPHVFVKTHLPFDPAWQFSDNPITLFEFNNQNYLKFSEKGNYNYRALISEIGNQDKLTYLEQINKRLLNLGELDELILHEIGENAFQITFEKGKLAVDSLNYAIDNYNLYVKHKNARFHNPNMEDLQLRDLISNIERPLINADVILQNTFTFNPDLRMQISDIRKSVYDFQAKMKIEKAFIDKYIKAKPSLRFLQFI